MIAVSRAPLQKLEAFKKRMGWNFKWVSSSETNFNFDYYVSFKPEDLANKQVFYNYALHDDVDSSEREGVSVFYQDREGRVFHTYSAYERGIDMLNTAYHYLDLVPKGRDEDRLDFKQAWVRYHDRYEN
jgi:predicted dithiol-disulfide oxidoreductase (DUF899 family)